MDKVLDELGLVRVGSGDAPPPHLPGACTAFYKEDPGGTDETEHAVRFVSPYQKPIVR